MTRNIVLLCLDAVRKDYFDEYAPRIQEAADVSFDQCRAASSWTVPSHASMLTGRLPHQHGIHAGRTDFSTLDVEETFLTEFRDHRTLGASANVYTSSAFGFADLFEEFSDVSPHRRFAEGMDLERFFQEREGGGWQRYLEFLSEAIHHGHPIQSLANGLVAKLDGWMRRSPLPKLFDDGATLVSGEVRRLIRAQHEPFFLYANFMDAHAPLQHVRGYDRSLHDVPDGWHSYRFDVWEYLADPDQERFERHIHNHRALYRATIDYLDRVVVDLVEWIHDQTDRETTVVVTADHGENLGFPADDYGFEHMASSLTEGLLHVPLIVLNPPRQRDDESRYVSQLDLGQLLRGLADGTVPDVVSDRLVAERIGLGASAAPTHVDAARFDRHLRCAYEDNRKFVWDASHIAEVYRLDATIPCWQQQHGEGTIPEWAFERFDTPIERYESEAEGVDRERGDLDDVTEQRLRDLGYR